MKEKKYKIQGNAANNNRSNSISVDPSTSNFIEYALKNDNLNSEINEASNVNLKNEETNTLEETK